MDERQPAITPAKQFCLSSFCEECCTPLQGRNKERLLNALFLKSLAFGRVFLLANSSPRYAIKKPA
ncbi:hypothetical protein SynSYN20_03233 [Synechococcus sp. SYN20]|nr:hypothetical protein SynSYN20_03233 [Synechococcus sp. SYN20]